MSVATLNLLTLIGLSALCYLHARLLRNYHGLRNSFVEANNLCARQNEVIAQQTTTITNLMEALAAKDRTIAIQEVSIGNLIGMCESGGLDVSELGWVKQQTRIQ